MWKAGSQPCDLFNDRLDVRAAQGGLPDGSWCLAWDERGRGSDGWRNWCRVFLGRFGVRWSVGMMEGSGMGIERYGVG